MAQSEYKRIYSVSSLQAQNNKRSKKVTSGKIRGKTGKSPIEKSIGFRLKEAGGDLGSCLVYSPDGPTLLPSPRVRGTPKNGLGLAVYSQGAIEGR